MKTLIYQPTNSYIYKALKDNKKIDKVNEIEQKIIDQLAEDINKNFNLKDDMRDLATKGHIKDRDIYQSALIVENIEGYLKKDEDLQKGKRAIEDLNHQPNGLTQSRQEVT